MDDSGLPSLFVVVNDDGSEKKEPESYFSILRLPAPPPLVDDDLVQQPVVSFNDPEGYPENNWLVSHPLITSPNPNYLYMFPEYFTCSTEPYHGYKYNLNTASLQKIPLPRIQLGYPKLLANHGGHIYYMARPHFSHVGFGLRDKSESISNTFECYDPKIKSWKALTPLPDKSPKFSVESIAYFDDTILLNIGRIWAYDVCRDEWYPVHVLDRPKECYSIEGDAVVHRPKEEGYSIQGDTVVWRNTIYALSSLSFNLILALCIQKEVSGGGDTVFKCSVHSEIVMPDDVRPIFFWFNNIQISPFAENQSYLRSRHLVHLGENDFCLVQSCVYPFLDEYKPIHVTYMKLIDGSSMTVMGVHEFKTRIELCKIQLCFSLPKGKSTALEECKPSDFILDPFTKGSASEEEDTEGSSEEEDIQGSSIFVTNLPKSANAAQLVKGLEKFGSIRNVSFLPKRTRKGRASAFVLFESATSKQCAVEEKTIDIGDLVAKIWESPLPQVDCSRTIRSFGKEYIQETYGEVS